MGRVGREWESWVRLREWEEEWEEGSGKTGVRREEWEVGRREWEDGNEKRGVITGTKVRYLANCFAPAPAKKELASDSSEYLLQHYGTGTGIERKERRTNTSNVPGTVPVTVPDYWYRYPSVSYNYNC